VASKPRKQPIPDYSPLQLMHLAEVADLQGCGERVNGSDYKRRNGYEAMLAEIDERGLYTVVNGKWMLSVEDLKQLRIPVAKTYGDAVFLGDQITLENNPHFGRVFFGWCARNEKEAYVRSVKMGTDRPTDILEFVPMSRGEYEALLHEWKQSECHFEGKWFRPHADFVAFMRNLRNRKGN
jgi:hypothetical protein